MSQKDQTISGRQIAAARTLIGITQPDLANSARISVPTLKRMEGSDGPASGMPNNVAAVRSALEAAGVEFIPQNGGGAGVRLRSPSSAQIEAKIVELDAKALALKPAPDAPKSPEKALRVMKRAVVKNEAQKLRNKLTKRRQKKGAD